MPCAGFIATVLRACCIRSVLGLFWGFHISRPRRSARSTPALCALCAAPLCMARGWASAPYPAPPRITYGCANLARPDPTRREHVSRGTQRRDGVKHPPAHMHIRLSPACLREQGCRPLHDARAVLRGAAVCAVHATALVCSVHVSDADGPPCGPVRCCYCDAVGCSGCQRG